MTDLPDPISRRDRQRQTREAIVFAARAAFAEAGYHGARLDRIARAAGFSKGAVYSNFAGKAELFLAVLDKDIEGSTGQGWNAFGTQPAGLAADGEAAEAVRGLALATLEFIAVAARNERLSGQVVQRVNQVVGAYAAVVESSRRDPADRAGRGGTFGGGAGEAGDGGTRGGDAEIEGVESRDAGVGEAGDSLTDERLGALLAALDQGAAVLSLAGSTAIDQSLLRAGMLRLLEPGRVAEPVSGSRDGEGGGAPPSPGRPGTRCPDA